jgi:hypothetical protein
MRHAADTTGYAAEGDEPLAFLAFRLLFDTPRFMPAFSFAVARRLRAYAPPPTARHPPSAARRHAQ